MRLSFGLIGLAFLGGCVTVDFSQSVPALLADDGVDYRPELVQTMSDALGGTTVKLEMSDLRTYSRVGLEQGPERPDQFGNPMSGRILDVPDSFTLVTQSGKCALLRDKTGEYLPLKDVRCRPA